ncbi:MAG: PEP-CTERM sorting domain-containing protein, partial [Planctomycetia bacterium]|nr:PEP-CTERM sorting domain-containing protein [Planctomycetia bacterium]
SGDGRVRPTDSVAGTFQGDALDMDGCINNTGRGIITTYSTVSYLAEVWVPETIVVDFAGAFDDTIGVFIQKISDDGTKGAWETVMDFGENCVNQSKQGYTLAAGHYLMDFRAVDQSGNAYAMEYITDSNGKRLGLGIRYNDPSTSSAKNNYYALDIDANGNIAFGDGSLLTSNPNKVFTADNVAIANGVTFTIDNPDQITQTMAVSGNFTGSTGTLRVTNTAGNTIPLTLKGSTEGNLSLGENMTVQLSKENVFDVAGSFTSDSALRFEVNLDGITEDMGWFIGADASGLDENSVFAFFATESLAPVELSFFSSSNFTAEQWADMIDFSGASGLLNYVASVGANGQLLLTVGDKASLPEPATWVMMVLAGGLLGFLQIRKKHKFSQKS